MGKRLVPVMVCDACGRERDPLLKARITLEGSRGMYADLCSECKKPLEKVLDRVAGHRGKGRVSVAELPLVDPDDVDGSG